ncbi:cellulose-binding domain-containing protein [Streptomyces sp. NBC_01077]|nr:cellulose-binding domain-containing protein [Streptomyces sp. NBC_01077]
MFWWRPNSGSAPIALRRDIHAQHVAAGASASFGFTGTWTGTNPVPAAFTLGGTTCSAA